MFQFLIPYSSSSSSSWVCWYERTFIKRYFFFYDGKRHHLVMKRNNLEKSHDDSYVKRCHVKNVPTRDPNLIGFCCSGDNQRCYHYTWHTWGLLLPHLLPPHFPDHHLYNPSPRYHDAWCRSRGFWWCYHLPRESSASIVLFITLLNFISDSCSPCADASRGYWSRVVHATLHSDPTLRYLKINPLFRPPSFF